jgi:hypothetical protein
MTAEVGREMAGEGGEPIYCTISFYAVYTYMKENYG